jgi:hypothetical protein
MGMHMLLVKVTCIPAYCRRPENPKFMLPSMEGGYEDDLIVVLYNVIALSF